MKLPRSSIIFAALFGLLLGLAAAALVVLLSAAPRGTPVLLEPAPPPAPIQIDISGAVRQPGVYTLPANTRVQEAVNAAGGLSDTADRAALNLAALVKDGQKLVIPAVGAAAALPDPASGSAGAESAPPSRSEPLPAAGDSAPAEPSGPVNLNTATSAELETLPGIGPSKAADIIAYRETHGGFKNIEEIQEVKGIGPATFEKLKDRITVE